jgi:hypothetical protein
MVTVMPGSDAEAAALALGGIEALEAMPDRKRSQG